MSDVTSNAKASPSRRTVKIQRAGTGPAVTTKFGNVTVTGDRPSAASVEANVARSSEILESLGRRLSKPGVRLNPKKGVPLFWIDEHDPGLFVRQLDGKIQRGRLIDGVFRVID